MSIFNKTKCFFCLPLIKCFIKIAFFYIALFLFIMPTHFDRKIQEIKIENSIKEIINKKCSDVFISWMIFEEKPFVEKRHYENQEYDDQVGQYTFDDVIGCVERKENCAISVKHLNPFYQQLHGVDLKSYYYLNSFKDNDVRHIENIELLKDKKAIYKAVTKGSILKVKDIYLITVRNHILINGVKTNVLYVFSLVHTEKTRYLCPASIAKEQLQELYREAEKNI